MLNFVNREAFNEYFLQYFLSLAMPESRSSLYKRIYIIDDDVEDQEIFIEAVKEVDPRVECFTSTNGEEALENLADGKAKPDLIFLDLNMPKLNGKQILNGIKRLDGAKDIPVIMYSTSFGPRDIEEIQRVGAAHHLLKPSRFDELCDSLRKIISNQW
jgi:CheY-like chemotaxis protein